MKNLLLLLILFTSIAAFSQTAIVSTSDSSVFVKPYCPCEKNKKVNKSGKKRSEVGKVLWVIVDILEEVVPFFKLLK